MARKSRAAVTRERQAVLETLRAYPAGLKQQALRQAHKARTGVEIPYSTIGRRLEELELEQRVRRNHRRRNPTYVPLLKEEVAERDRPARGLDADHGITLSAQGEAALELLRRPRGQRLPVTYRPEFLGAYVPGTTWYLAAGLRDHLRALGTTAYAGQPAGTYARDIMQRLIIDLSWGSSRLEGNKYSRIDTEDLIQGGHEPDEASDVDRQMILNHKAAIEFLVENAQEIDFDRHTILTLHALLSENLIGNPEDEGRVRTRPVGIGTSVYTPIAIPQVIDEQFHMILAKARAIPDALEQAFFMMVHIPYLQPFLDVNKRTSRLAANISLIKANLCPLSFVDVPQDTYTDGMLAIYEQNDVALMRDVFAWAYQRSCAQFTVLREAMGTPDPIRLKYRTELRALVSDVVTAGVWPDDEDLLARAATYGIPVSDHQAFATAARRDLLALRADTLGRYRLRHSVYEVWREAIGSVRERVAEEARSA